jgi:hypothetical protein
LVICHLTRVHRFRLSNLHVTVRCYT